MNRPLSDDEIVALVKAGDPVAEPSPLFWEHAARRVRAAVDAEPRRSAWFGRPAWTAGGLIAASLAAWLVVAPRPVNDPSRHVGTALVVAATHPESFDEESWTVVASLGDELDVESASGVGLVAPGQTTDRALEELDADERAELGTLLNRALEEPEI